MSNPLTPAEVTAWLREQAHRHAVQAVQADAMGYIDSATHHDHEGKRYATAADLIESLGRERDGLAAMVLAKDEALKGVQEIAKNVECPACGASIGEHVDNGYYDRDADWTCHGESPGKTEDVRWQIDAIKQMQAALALELPAAVAQVAEWKECRDILTCLLRVEPDTKEEFELIKRGSQLTGTEAWVVDEAAKEQG
jgi:hypothetical protein